jgi:membrane protease YdiL (CAAX protease family)
VNLSRIRPLELLGALAIPPVVAAASVGLSRWWGQPADQLKLSSSGNLMSMVILSMILAPIIEETGWRGYGVDSLRARMGTLQASLTFGILWSLWHAPLVFVPGTYHYELAHMENPMFLVNFFVSVVPAAVIANWVYYRCNRSLLANMALHSVMNAAAVLPSLTQTTKCIATVLYTVVAVALVVFDRRTFGEGPRNFLGEPVGSPLVGSRRATVAP